MVELEVLFSAVSHFSGMSRQDFDRSSAMWQVRTYRKGDYYNRHKSVCKYLGFITSGAFRSYVINEQSAEERNVFLYSAHGFVVTFKSFINQIPCDYHTQALSDANVVHISIGDLLTLYKESHAWETFGRLLAQTAFNVTMSRIEGFVFKTPEQRYLDLIKEQPEIINSVPLYHISSYLGIQGPSLSRIRKRLLAK